MWLEEAFRIWGLIHDPKGWQGMDKRLDKGRGVGGFWTGEEVMGRGRGKVW